MTTHNPHRILDRTRNAIAEGDVREYATPAYQAANSAAQPAARWLEYTINREDDVGAFLLALDGVPPQPPG